MKLAHVVPNLAFMSYKERREFFSNYYDQRNEDLQIARDLKVTATLNKKVKAQQTKRGERVKVTNEQYELLKSLGVI